MTSCVSSSRSCSKTALQSPQSPVLRAKNAVCQSATVALCRRYARSPLNLHPLRHQTDTGVTPETGSTPRKHVPLSPDLLRSATGRTGIPCFAIP